jgi:hypothetical protein
MSKSVIRIVLYYECIDILNNLRPVNQLVTVTRLPPKPEYTTRMMSKVGKPTMKKSQRRPQ